MACGEPPTPGSLLATCREPDSPHLQAVVDPDARFDEHAQYVANLTYNQIGKVSEQAAERFLQKHFHLKPQGTHNVNARGIDHLTISGANMIVVVETKGTAGLGRVTQAAYARGRNQQFGGLTGRHQGSDPWLDKDPSLLEAGLGHEVVAGVVGARVDVLSQSVDLWERNPSGGWDFVGMYGCPTDDLVAAQSA